MFKETGKLPKERREVKNTPDIVKGKELVIGEGNIAYHHDRRGSWWGSDNPDTAPVFVGNDGIIVLRATTETANTSFQFYYNGKLMMYLGFKDVA